MGVTLQPQPDAAVHPPRPRTPPAPQGALSACGADAAAPDMQAADAVPEARACVALCSDASFCVLAAATRAALIRHASSGCSHHICIIHGDLGAGSRRTVLH